MVAGGKRFYWHVGRFTSIVAAALVVSLSAGVLVCFMVSRALPPQIPVLPSRLMPGHGLPNDADCTYTPYVGGTTTYCSLTLNGQPLSITYDVRRKTIVRTTVPIDERNVGELMQAWGSPTAMQVYQWGIELRWPNRSVYVSRHNFSPDSLTSFIDYDLETNEEMPRWAGFAHAD
jgi:hypothetical protein